MSYPTVILSRAVTVYLRFGELSGLVADNAQGSATYDADYLPNNGVSWSGGTLGVAGALAGDANTAIQFSGASGYAQNANLKTPFGGQSKGTIEAWVYRASAGTSSHWGFSSNNPGRFGVQWGADNVMYVVCENGGAAYGFVTVSTSGWHHVVVVFDGTLTGNANRLKVYVNNVQQTLSFSGTIPATLPTAGTLGNFEIGRWTESLLQTSNGNRFDEVAAYAGVALSSTEVGENYAAATATDTTITLPSGRTITLPGALTEGVDYGTYWDGTYWIKPATGITTSIPPTGSGSTRRNGAAINFAATGFVHPFDGRSPTYDASQEASYPWTLAAGNALVMVESFAESGTATDVDGITVGPDAIGYTCYVKSVDVLICVALAPSANSFRPSFYGTTRKSYVLSDADLTTLPALAKTAHTPTLASLNTHFTAPWFEAVPAPTQRAMHPYTTQSNYGQDVAWNFSKAAFLLCCSDVGDRTSLARRIIQVGIDLHGAWAAGYRWKGEGGILQGLMWPILFAGKRLNDSDMLGVAAAIRTPTAETWGFQELDQTFYVGAYTIANGTGYTNADLNLPEWGRNHQAWINGFSANKDDASLTALYRDINGPSWLGYVIAMDRDGLRSTVTHEALFDYIARYTPLIDQDHDAFFQEMWATYPVLPANPPAPTLLACGTPTANSIPLTWQDNSTDEIGFTVERAEDSAFTINVVDTDISTADTQTANITGLAAAKTYYFRVRAYNSNGVSAWSNTASATTLNIFAVRQNAAGNTTVTFGSPTLANSLLAVFFDTYPDTITFTSVTDDAGNIYSRVVRASGLTVPPAELWVCLNPVAGATTITTVISGGSAIKARAVEITGATSWMIGDTDVATDSSGSNAPATPPLTIDETSIVLCGLTVYNGGNTMTPGTGFTLVSKTESGALADALEWREASADVTPAWSLSGNDFWACCAVAFRAAPTTTTVESYGITWTVPNAATIGTYTTDGTPWVVDSGSGVNVSEVSPAPTGSDSSARNGSVVDPTLTKYAPLPALIGTHYDGRSPSYNGTERVAFPLILTTGQSLISTESSTSSYDLANAANDPDSSPFPSEYSDLVSGRLLKNLSILTCVASAPAANAFRPPLVAVAGGKPNFTTDDVDLSWLPNLPLPAGATAPNYNHLMRVFERPHACHSDQHLIFDTTAMQNTQCVYGREFRLAYFDAILSLCLDSLTLTQKQNLAYRIIQQGIDAYYAAVAQPDIWRANGGHTVGRKGLILFAAKALGKLDEWDLSGMTFSEDDEYAYASDYGRTVQTSGWATSGHAYASDVVFGITDPARETYHPNVWHLPPFPRTAGNWPWNREEGYGRQNANTILGMALAGRLFGLMDYDGNDAFFDFADRWAYDTTDAATKAKFTTAAAANGWNALDTETDWTNAAIYTPAANGSLSSFQKAMYLEYRASTEPPVTTGIRFVSVNLTYGVFLSEQF